MGVRRVIARLSPASFASPLSSLANEAGENPAPVRVLAVHFSGDPAPAVQRREIAVAEVEAGEEGLQAEVRARFTWESLADRLSREAILGTVVGLGFALSFPRGHVARATGAAETWDSALDYAHEGCERLLRECPPPFWGRGGSVRPKPEALTSLGIASLYRRTDLAWAPPRSVFQVAGPNANGTASLRGMAWLRRERIRSAFHGWPFDGPAPAGRPVLLELPLRAFEPDVRREDPRARKARLAEIRARNPSTDLGGGGRSVQADEESWAVAEGPAGFSALAAALGLVEALRLAPGLLAEPSAGPGADADLRYEGWGVGPPRIGP